MESIRTFIAVDLPQEVKMEIDRLISGLRPFGPGIRWVKAVNLHLTLRFLGNISPDSVASIAESLEQNINRFGPFTLSLSGLGAFPHLERPRVIWAGVGEGRENLARLAPMVEKSCIDCGLGKADKPFSPHLTIGRVKFQKNLRDIAAKIGATDFKSSPFKAEEVVVFRSDLSPAGPKYTSLKAIKL